MVPKIKVIVVTPDGTLLHGTVIEVSKGDMFSVGILGGDITLHFLGPPDDRGWCEGGANGYLRRGYFCTQNPSNSRDKEEEGELFMSIDRCKIVYDTIKALLTGDDKIARDTPEVDGVYSITVSTASFTQAGVICATITQKFASVGFSLREIHMTQIGKNVLMAFDVDVGGSRQI